MAICPLCIDEKDAELSRLRAELNEAKKWIALSSSQTETTVARADRLATTARKLAEVVERFDGTHTGDSWFEIVHARDGEIASALVAYRAAKATETGDRS